MSRRTAYFETLTPLYYPVAWWLLVRGYRLFVFDFEPSWMQGRWAQRALENETLERIYIHSNSKADSLAVDATEWLFARLPDTGLRRSLHGIYGREEADPVCKKALLESVFRYLFMATFLRSRSSTHPEETAVLIPHMALLWEHRLHGWDGEGRREIREPLPCPSWIRHISRVLRTLQEARVNLAFGAGILTHLAFIAMGYLFGRRGPPESGFQHLYAIDQEFQIQFEKARRFDFLLDGESLTKENTAFLVHPKAEGEWMEKAVEEGFRMIKLSRFADVRSPYKHAARPPSRILVKPVLRAAAHFLLFPLNEDWEADVTGRGLFAYLTRSRMLDELHFLNYIYTIQEHLSQLWLNALLRISGRRSWNFDHSTGSAFIYGSNTQFGHRNRIWAYKNPDHYVAPSRQLVDYYRSHPQNIRFYHNVGNIWSELILSYTDPEREMIRREWFRRLPPDARIAAWFDTTFIEATNSPSTYSEAIAWYGDIRTLLSEDTRLHAVIKPIRPRWRHIDRRSRWAHPLGKEVVALWDILKSHPRVYFAGHTGDPSEIIAASDLTITFCFSAPTAEALGARKKGIWYEPGTRWRGTLYDQKLLLAHGIAELRSLMRKLLYEVSDEEYGHFLEADVRGRVEDFMDGKGLSRFRELVASSAPVHILRPAAVS